MPGERDFIVEPSDEQCQAWEHMNFALGILAAAYAVNPDDVNELGGACLEEVIRNLTPKEAA